VRMPPLRLIRKEGFEINAEKTRMQYRNSRQDVTGLIVNTKVSCRVEYRRTVRAMVDRLLRTGNYQRKHITRDDGGAVTIAEKIGTMDELNGMLSFINSVDKYNMEKDLTPQELKKHYQPAGNLTSTEKTFRRFLLYKHFYANPLPLIVCEGKTDNVYLESAIRQLADSFPLLARKKPDGKMEKKVAFLKRTSTLGRILGLTGGSSELTNLMQGYLSECRDCLTRPEKINPVIFLIDNDTGAKDIYSYAKKHTSPVTKDMPVIYMTGNIYIVPTPLAAGKDTMIEDLFDEKIRGMTLNGKVFNPSNKKIDHKTEYGKALFAEHIIRKNAGAISFEGFKPLLRNIETVINEHKAK